MPALVHCSNPSCRQPLPVPESSSPRELVCPRCRQTFLPPAASEVAAVQTLDLPDAAPRAASAIEPTGASPAVTLDLPAAHQPQQPQSPAPTLDLPSAGAQQSQPPPGVTLDLPAAAEPQTSPPAPVETITHFPPAPTSDPKVKPKVPERIGRFQIRRFLGEGAFGRVYEAYDPQLDRLLALKVAKPEQLQSEGRVQRFLREARAAANLRHPNIVPVFDSGSDAGHYFIGSAFIKGQSLERTLEQLPQGKRLGWQQSAALVRKVAEALAYAHGRGIVHRDVKPANIMLDEEGQPLLMDFGLAARHEAGAEKLTQEGMAMGTPAYMAPEQWSGEAVAASDQYSLGCTLYELLTGQTPFSGTPEIQMVLHLKEEVPSPRKLQPRLPRDLETITLKCLEKDPGKRYASCQALADDLRRFLDGEPIQARRLGLGERLVRWVRKEPRLAFTGVLAASLLITTVVVLAVSDQAQRHLTEKVQGENKAKQEALDDLQVAKRSRSAGAVGLVVS